MYRPIYQITETVRIVRVNIPLLYVTESHEYVNKVETVDNISLTSVLNVISCSGTNIQH